RVSFCRSSSLEINTLSLHDALPISIGKSDDLICPVVCLYNACYRFIVSNIAIVDRLSIEPQPTHCIGILCCDVFWWWHNSPFNRSEEHTSELQSRENLVCRLLLEKK